ncbi:MULTISPECIES: thioredoxin fold domain-containing protein [Morganellaceae]|uniref:Thioredoxin fold domain-containing protein n=1 Tax=Proteus genomosp. 6 TaxID=1311820 RepID=A0ABV1LES5_9GAMM|nr:MULTISPECIES: thioredoxin fold domain-containing protein [Morganellaceae]MDY0822223.1 thioredoxin fold domain-containing protein [Providencia rettgeri]UPS65130.1 thioredoxin fold domain-containing protein [Providencia rettgeri]WIF74375.1 thioredoxin fold domain-containing protein [Proteus vulgaris]WJW83702.1 thioredoxin fold domain-containing protein [Moellerella wisconsensis]
MKESQSTDKYADGAGFKMKNKIHLSLISLALAFTTAHAHANYADIEKTNTQTVFNQEALKAHPTKTPDIPKFLLPSNGIIALNNNGNLQLLTSNGRFVIKGTLYDTWAKKDLTSFEEIQKFGSIIPVKNLNIKMDDLQSATWGKGPKQTIIFTDPFCVQCHETLQQLNNLDPEKYTVHVLSVGVLNSNSQQRNFELYCAKDRYRADRAIITGNNSVRFDQIENCDREALMKREITAQVFGVSMIPFIIRDDGTYNVGKPVEGLKSFLESGK